LKIVADTVADY